MKLQPLAGENFDKKLTAKPYFKIRFFFRVNHYVAYHLTQEGHACSLMSGGATTKGKLLGPKIS